MRPLHNRFSGHGEERSDLSACENAQAGVAIYCIFGKSEIVSSRYSGIRNDIMGIMQTFHFLGHRGIDEIPGIYGISDILVLPSISEPWGLVVDEAMACGCAIIASDRCGCSKDLIQNNGIVVEGGKLYPLVEALEKILSCESRLEAMKEKSMEIIGRHRCIGREGQGF